MTPKRDEWPLSYFEAAGLRVAPIPGAARYLACSDGTVLSYANFHGGADKLLHRMAGYIDQEGYHRVTVVRDDGNRLTRQLGYFILEAFVGPRPAGLEVCHFPDRSPSNNRPDNLRWDTHARNIADKSLHGTVALGERHGNARLTDEQVAEIRDRRSRGEWLASIAADFKISQGHVSGLCSKKYRPKIYKGPTDFGIK